MAASTSLTPAQRTERARKAAIARNSLDTYIKSIVARASELSPEQIVKLRDALSGLETR